MEGMVNRKVYVKIIDGMMERTALPGDDVRHMIVKQDAAGNNYDVIRFNYLEGMLSGIYVTTREIKGRSYDFLNVKIEQVGEERVLSIFLDSNPARDILTRYENIDLSRFCRINLGVETKNNVDREFIWITQDEGKVAKKYTKDTPGDMPSWEKVTYNGSDAWDRTKQLKWWKSQIKMYAATPQK